LTSDNVTAKFAARVTRGARNKEIVGFAATCLMEDGSFRTTWFAQPSQFLALSGAATGLVNEIAFYQMQQKNVQGLPIASRKKVKKKR
jgi:hypothetical protein